MKQFIIAEAGVNHNGDINLAFDLIKVAAECGADAVKFQTFKAENLAAKDTPKVAYQTVDRPESEESHYEMLKRLELSNEDTVKVKRCCEEHGVEFMSTPYDPEGVEFLAKIGSRRLKVASADLVDFRIQRAVRRSGLSVIQSMGMATEDEVLGWHEEFRREAPGQHRTLLQCTSNYPSDPFNANLRAMKAMGEKLGVDYGFSDHTSDHRATVLAVALGATVVEKHFTLDRTMKGPDHKASVDPVELRDYVQAVRDADAILGSDIKDICEEEMDMRRISRKGVFALRDLASGQTIREEDFTFHRPGTGVDMGNFLQVLGSVLKKSLSRGELLSQDHI
jgi:N,N'-diacetyllegionaminate synthase